MRFKFRHQTPFFTSKLFYILLIAAALHTVPLFVFKVREVKPKLPKKRLSRIELIAETLPQKQKKPSRRLQVVYEIPPPTHSIEELLTYD